MESGTRGNYSLSDVLSGLEISGDNTHGEQYEIVSRVAYLIGIPKKIFDNEHEPPKIEVFNKLEKEKKARIIRNLCILRNQMEHCFSKICKAIQQEQRSIMAMPEYIPSDVLQKLYEDGIDIYKNMREPNPFVFMLNQNINNRINNCKDLFPEWINWDYLSSIFIMPEGTNEEGVKKAADFFYENEAFYPYQVYMNWPAEDEGNILFNDKRFVTLLYSWNSDEFRNISLVSDVSGRTKANIYTYIENSDKCVFIVDCENSDPYNLCAAIRNLDQERLEKIEKIILFDDVHAASAWEMLGSYISIPVEYILIGRLKDNKSLADVKVTARTCKEFYENGVDSFVLVSSDSDYWGLIQELPEAKFMIMVEHRKCSPALKEALMKNDIFYCFIDDFYSGGGDDIKTAALDRELSYAIKASLDLNLNNIMQEVLVRTRIDMTADEVNAFIRRRLKGQIKLEINEDNDVELVYKIKR